MIRNHHLAAPLLLLALGVASPTASAQQPQAQPQVQQQAAAGFMADVAAARALREKGDLAGARARFEAMFDATKSAIAGFELAYTLRLMNDLNGAYDICGQVLELKPVTPDEMGAQNAARQLFAEVDALIPMVILDIGPVAPDVTRISLDAVDLPPFEWGEPQPVNPGKHVVLVYLRDGSALKKVFTIAERGRAKLTFRIPGAPVAGAPAPGADTPPPPRVGPCPAGSIADSHNECVNRSDYGWQLAVVDGLATVTIVAGFAAESGELVGIGTVAYLFASPAVHWSHSRVGRGFGSFGFHAGAALGGLFAIAAAAASQDVETRESETQLSTTTASLYAIVAGVVGFGLDFLIIPHTHDTKLTAQTGLSKPTFTIAPARGGAIASLGFVF